MCASGNDLSLFLYLSLSLSLSRHFPSGIHFYPRQTPLPLSAPIPCLGCVVWADQREVETESGASLSGGVPL